MKISACESFCSYSRKKALETLAETKKQKQQEGEEVKRTKKSGITGNKTLAYLKRGKAAKDHEVKMLQMKTQNEEDYYWNNIIISSNNSNSKLSNKYYYSCRISNRQ